MDPGPFWARFGQEWICTLFHHSYQYISKTDIPFGNPANSVLLCTLPHDCVIPVHYPRDMCYLCIASNMYIIQCTYLCATSMMYFVHLRNCVLPAMHYLNHF